MDEKLERRREQYRQSKRLLIASMSPEELANYRAERNRYFAEYRAKNREKIRRQKRDSTYRARENELRRTHYLLKRARPRPVVSEREINQRKAASDKAWRLKNVERQKNHRKQYYAANRERLLAQKSEYGRKNRKVLNVKRKALLDRDVGKRIVQRLRSRLCHLLRGTYLSLHTMDMLGCTRDELMKHLESQFVEGMTWENYGTKGWSVDHKKAVSLFDHTDEAQVKACWHYTNLQPLWFGDNSSKGNRPMLNSVNERVILC